MCLITKQRAPEVAENAITCYKAVDVLSRKEDIPDVFRSQYYLFCYELGKTYELDDWSKSISFDNDCIPLPDPSGNICVSHGFHSYVSMEAINFDPQSCKRNGIVIAKCVIPCGAYYWKGVRSGSGEYKGGEYDEYCSDQIRFIAWTEPDKIEWRRPKVHEGDWPEPGKKRVSILNGLTIDEAAERLPYNFCHAYELHAGFRNYLYHSPEYGYIELHTRYGVVVDGIA